MRRQGVHTRGLVVSRRRAVGVIGVGAAGVLLSACRGSGQRAPAATDFSGRFAAYEPDDEPNGDLATVVWPDFVTRAGPEVQELYAFQVEHGELMRYMPCFCGCHWENGHRNNRDCYVEAVNPDGSVVFDPMAPT